MGLHPRLGDHRDLARWAADDPGRRSGPREGPEEGGFEDRRPRREEAAATTDEAKREFEGQLQKARADKPKSEGKWRAKNGLLPVLPKLGYADKDIKVPHEAPEGASEEEKKKADQAIKDAKAEQKKVKGSWLNTGQIYREQWPLELLWTFLFCTVLLLIAGAFLKFDLKLLIPGFLVIFVLAILANVVGASFLFKKVLQFSPVLFALAFGLLISNVFKVPKFLKAAGQTEFFVKIGLVCMGAGILFADVIRAGIWGLLQAVLVATAVWFMTYWICRRFKVSERFSAIIATANSICGVSATIAAGGAIQGKPKEVSYMVAWVLVCAVILILVMPPIAGALGLRPAWAGAWVGGVIDNTGAVVAAGDGVSARHGEGAGDIAVTVASIVKMAQNVLIGFAAFLMALWATMSLEKKEAGADYVKPGFGEVWYRFPKFVVGFIVALLFVSLAAQFGLISEGVAKGIGEECKVFRNLFFGLCFVSIGLETNFKELVSVGGGRPAIAYWISQIANAFWTLFITWILWSGQVLKPPF